MNKIIGTAGHVDHGKSALIYALTGVEQMRLPEEKKRGMTIDLGFSSFTHDNLTVGVIDVPGHERFIRNMVAGIWSLNLCLLVVCAEDGFMPMTFQHAKVAKALNIKNVICVINKIDLVDDEKLKLQEKNIKEHLDNIFERDIEIVKVSALKNIGIDNLKKRIIDILLKDTKTNINNKPYIYVDRVFTVKGAGLTITGSLKNGLIKKDNVLVHYTSEKEVGVRTIHSYNKEREEVEAVSRIAINLKNIEKENIDRGDILASKELEVFTTKEIVLELDDTTTASLLRKIKNVEFAIGTECLIAKVYPMFFPLNKKEKADNKKKVLDERFIRLSFEENISLLWKSRGVLISHGGSNIVSSGRVFWAKETDFTMRKNIVEKSSNFLGDKKESDYISVFMSIMGYTEVVGNSSTMPSGSVKINQFFVDEEFLKSKTEKILALLKKEQDRDKTSLVSFETIKKISNLKADILKSLLDYLVEKKNIILINSSYKLFEDSNNITSLTISQKTILNELKKAGLNGLEEKNIKALSANASKDIRLLVQLKQAVYLDEGIYYSKETYEKIASVILKGKSKGQILTLAETKEKTNLSRKYTIPILNALERDRLVKRVGNDREIL